MKKRIAITGASGFIGKHLLKALTARGYEITVFVRSPLSNYPSEVNVKLISDLDQIQFSLGEFDALVHLAGIAFNSGIGEPTNNEKSEYFRVNCQQTISLFEKCISAKINRFYFLSTALVHGNSTLSPINESQDFNPQSPYAQSKMRAEKGIRETKSGHETSYTIVRIPPVYGQGVKGNLGSIEKLVRKQIPTPFGSFTDNKRSFLSVDNLTDFINSTLFEQKACNETFFLSDDDDVSTYTLFSYMYEVTGTRRVMIPVPIWLLSAITNIIGKKGLLDKLVANFQLDIRKAKTLVGWKPKVNLYKGLEKMVEIKND